MGITDSLCVIILYPEAVARMIAAMRVFCAITALLIINTSTGVLAKAPKIDGYWQMTNLPVVYKIDAKGSVLQLGTDQSRSPVTGNLVFEEDGTFEIRMRHHMIIERGYFSDGRMYLVNKDQNMDIWIPEIELKRISEKQAKRVATFYSNNTTEDNSDNAIFKRLREERSKKYLQMIQDDEMEGLVANSYYVLADRDQPIALKEAMDDLEDERPNVRFAAALYLAKYERSESVPVLIEAIGHKRFRSKDKPIEALVHLTGEDFGPDYASWSEWWESNEDL